MWRRKDVLKFQHKPYTRSHKPPLLWSYPAAHACNETITYIYMRCMWLDYIYMHCMWHLCIRMCMCRSLIYTCTCMTWLYIHAHACNEAITYISMQCMWLDASVYTYVYVCVDLLNSKQWMVLVLARSDKNLHCMIRRLCANPAM